VLEHEAERLVDRKKVRHVDHDNPAR
jgi:hypothetical protein